MADRTVRAIFDAKVDGAKKAITGFGKDVADAGKKVDGLTKDLKALDAAKVKPDLDIEIDAAKKKLKDLTGELSDLKSQPQSLEVDFKIEQTKAAIKDVRGLIKDLTAQKAEVRVEASIKDAQQRISDLTQELGDLRTMEATPQVKVDIAETQKRLRDAKTELRELNSAKAEMKVTADTSQAKSALSGLSDDAGDAGSDAGDEAGGNMVKGIIGALASIPIAGAVIGVGAAIATGILKGIQDGLQIEAGRDLFSARTGLDEATSARFGRAAGEAYSQAWGDSVEANLDTARTALEQGLIDADAIDADVQKVIASLSGISEIMEADIPTAARAAGQLIKTGLAKDADEAFDVLVAGYQNGADASKDLLDTLIEYPTHFRDLGLSAADATGLLIQGMDGGAFNSDKVADSLKELTIKVKELDSTAAPALKTLGLNGKEMSAAFAEGGPAARDALDQILTKLSGVQDPAERARLAVDLFGTQAEDMAAALGNLNLDKAASELGNVAGAADRALATMSDNAATKIEEAKRNISVAADGIKGALASAFSDEISGAAEWVSRNRAPLMQFFVDVINAALDAAEGFAEFGATALESIAQIVGTMAGLADAVPGLGGMAEGFRELANGAQAGADGIRNNIPAALEETRNSINSWAGPEIMKARVHDATMAMAGDMDAFSAKVNASGGKVTINGDKVPAEEALDILVSNINAEDGTVTIDGDRVPAEDALDVLMGKIDNSEGDVTVGGNTRPANADLQSLLYRTNASKASVQVGGNTRPGRSDLSSLLYKTNASRASVQVGASTGGAERAINYTARDRSTTIRVNYAYSSSGSVYRSQVPGAHEGRRLTGLNAGGRVPGTDPGRDNILWPLVTGGQTLQQPLAGGEWVINSRQSAIWDPVLAAINAGAKPGVASAPSLTGVRISGQLSLDGRLEGVITAVDDFMSGAPLSSAMNGG